MFKDFLAIDQIESVVRLFHGPLIEHVRLYLIIEDYEAVFKTTAKSEQYDILRANSYFI